METFSDVLAVFFRPLRIRNLRSNELQLMITLTFISWITLNNQISWQSHVEAVTGSLEATTDVFLRRLSTALTEFSKIYFKPCLVKALHYW